MENNTQAAAPAGEGAAVSADARRLPLALRLGLWAAAFALALVLALQYGETSGVHNDFTQNVWLPARLVLDGADPYDPTPAQVAAALGPHIAQFGSFNSGGEYNAIYPMWVNLVFTPFAMVPLDFSLAVWRALMLLLLVWAVAHILRASNPSFRRLNFGALTAIGVTVILASVFRESLVNIIVGQFAIIELGLLAAIWGYLIASKEDTGTRRLVGDSVAGLALAVLATKPQSVGLAVLLIVVWAITRKRWVIPLLATAVMALLLLLPLAGYPGSLGGWIGVVVGGQAASQVEVSASVWGVSYQLLSGLLPWEPVALALTIAGLVLLVPYWWWDLTDRSSPVPLSLPVTLCVNSIVSPYLLGYEHVVLLLPALVFLATAGLPGDRTGSGARRWRMAIYAWIGALPYLILALQVVEDKEYVTVIQSATMLAICVVAQLGWSNRAAQAPQEAPQPSQLQGA